MIDEVIWSPESEDDLSIIITFLLTEWNFNIANSFIKELDYHVNKIFFNPQLYPIIYKPEQFRKCVVTKHNSLIYNVIDDKLYILRVFDTRQDPIKLKFNK
ncbi:MAG: type II toxin-antitoxin system RelE/ParE family toxin [Pelobium sp.]